MMLGLKHKILRSQFPLHLKHASLDNDLRSILPDREHTIYRKLKGLRTCNLHLAPILVGA
ncbi:MAG: hypothetical protein V7K39_01825 [Nostoc sp.]